MRPKNLLFLSLFGSWMILDGAFYAFYYSLLLISVFVLSGVLDLRIFAGILLGKWKSLIYCGFVFLLVTLPKTYPILTEGFSFPVREHFSPLPYGVITNLFLDFQQTNDMQISSLPWRLHEYGCYFGFLFVGLLVLTFMRASKNRDLQVLKIGACLLVFFWIATGWGYPINPWILHQKLPFFSKLHVQSRMLVLVMFLAIWMLMRYYPIIFKHRKILGLLLAAILLCEWGAVRFFNWQQIYHRYATESLAGDLLITQVSLKQTVEFAEKPDHYFSESGSRDCYEPQLNYPVKARIPTDPDYRGEVYLVSGTGSAEIKSFSPAGINVKYAAEKGPVSTQLNMIGLPGWKVLGGEAQLTNAPFGLLQVESKAASGELTFVFEPRGYPWLALVQALGLLLAAMHWWLERRFLTKNLQIASK